MIIRRLIVPLTAVAITALAAEANAQGAFPAPLPGQAAPSNASPFPPVNGSAPAASFGTPSAFPSNGAAPITGAGAAARPMGPPPQQAGAPNEACMKQFVPLREETEKRGLLVKAASERHAGPDEACKLLGAYSKAELEMMKYIQRNSQKCGIPPQINEQIKKSHAFTEKSLKNVCGAAQAAARGPAGPSLSEVLGSSAVLPEATTTAKKNGGTTFDTLNGNVLAR